MMELPGWLHEFREKAHCPNCSNKLSKKGVFGIGIREEIIRNKKITSFCFEYLCPSCKNRTVFTGFPLTMEQFAESVGELIMSSQNAESEASDEQETLKPKSKRKTTISDSEIKKFSKTLQKMQSHEEFLEKLGINIQELKKYKNEDK